MIKYITVSSELSAPTYCRNIQLINVIESSELRQIFLMLRKGMKDSDIPHHSTLRNRIEEVVEEQVQVLEKEMSVSFSS